MSSTKKVKDCLRKSFADADHFGFDKKTQVVVENMPYDSRGVPYVHIFVIPNDVTPFDVADTDETDGVFRIILRYPTDKFTLDDVEQKTDEIEDYYTIGRKFEHNGQTVQVRKRNTPPGVVENGWHKMIVDIIYNAYMDRQ